MNSEYGAFKKENLIDKTEALEKGIIVFPSIYIEGAAASGKTTAVQMLLAKHPEISSVTLLLEEELENAEEFAKKLQLLKNRIRKEAFWLVFEDVPSDLPVEIAEDMRKMVQQMHKDSRVIFVGRNRMPEEFLELFWKKKLDLIPQESLRFTLQEVKHMIHHTFMGKKSGIDADELYEVTAGWAGCVSAILHLLSKSMKNKKEESISIQKVRDRYEIHQYIKRNIVESLSEEEQRLVHLGQLCPWIDATLCEDLWKLKDVQDGLEDLTRKGILVEKAEQWRLVSLFRHSDFQKDFGEGFQEAFWKNLGNWYGRQGFQQEMFWCFDHIEGKEDSSLEMCYFRGMRCISRQDWDALEEEMQKMGRDSEIEEEAFQKSSVYFNLMYQNPRVSISDWLTEVSEKRHALKEQHISEEFQLFSDKKQYISCLGGVRDLTELFACQKKREHHNEKLWRQCLDEEAWKIYQMARIEYYMETGRLDAVSDEDWELLKNKTYQEKQVLSVLLFLYRLQAKEFDEEREEHIQYLLKKFHETDSVYTKNAEYIQAFYKLLDGDVEGITQWRKLNDVSLMDEVNEENEISLYFRAKGYLYLAQYERAERILQKLIAFYQRGGYVRFLAEAFFELAIIYQNTNQSGKAMKSVIESFVVNGDRRFVEFYTEYGLRGKEVLELYINWLKNTEPEKWSRKKKYNYGNVLRMPVEDYVETLLRRSKKRIHHSYEKMSKSQEERLTMMETLVLQNLSQGLTNAQIGTELNLKLTTVKSHIYNLYRKLDVNNRTQAILKGKQMGILE